MRWPLRNQIMLPMMGVMLVSLVGVSVLNAYLSGRRVKQQVEHQLQEVESTLAESNFPLTEAVLTQMRGLTGAEFVLANNSGQLVSSSMNADLLAIASSLPLQIQPQQPEELTLGKPIEVGGQRFFHAAVQLLRPNAVEQSVRLHILYPEESYQEVWRQAVYPPLIIGMIALLLVALFAATIASRVVRPMLRLQDQVGRISEGDFRRIELPQRDDEVRDLTESISRMAELLNQYEEQVRRNEQLRTLGQLGSGIAHQIRNSATGCKLAIELHQRDCMPGSDCDCLNVANRQLMLMEKQLKRFSSLGKPCENPKQAVDIAALVESTLPLLQPYASHVGIAFAWNPPGDPLIVKGDFDAIEQVLLNLLLNAIEASQGNADSLSSQRSVGIRLSRNGIDHVVLEIANTGRGPSVSLQNSLFEPFVTDKPDGTGLGLSVAKEIVEQHNGTIQWRHCDNTTYFSVELPMQETVNQPETFPSMETPCVEVARS